MPHNSKKTDGQFASFEAISPREMTDICGGADIFEQKVRSLPNVQVRDLELNQATNTL